MAKDDFKNKSKTELNDLLKEKRNLLREFRFKIAKSKAKDNKEGQKTRKDVARILTAINEN